MLLRVAGQRRSLVLCDFLASSLVRPQSTSFSRLPPASASQSNSAAPVFDQLRKQLAFVHSSKGHRSPGPNAETFNNALVNIRRALDDNDVFAILQYCQELEQNQLFHYLGSSDLKMISVLLTKSLKPKSKILWDVSQRNIAEEVALRAALGRSPDALDACMLFYLKEGNPEAVIRLYARFMDLLGEREVWDESPVDDDEKPHSDITMLATDAKAAAHRIPLHPERINTLLAVVAAHTMRDSFGAALQACLATAVRFHDYTTNQFLVNFAHDRALKQKIKLYVERLTVARMVARPPSLSKHVMNLSAAPNTKLLEKLYQSLIDGLTGPDPYLAPDPSAITPSRSVALTEVGWTSFMVAFLKCGRRDLASNIWTDMARFNIVPGVPMWTALLDAYDTMHAVDDATAAWNMMLAQGVKPDGLTYRALISNLFHARKSDDAMRIFQTFRKELIHDCPVPQILSVYNTVLHGLLLAERLEEADVLMESMHAGGPEPDIVSYNTFLAYHARQRDFRAIAALLNRMAAKKIVGDVYSFSTMLSAMLKAGRDDAPEMLLSIMQKQGVRPNAATFSAIIDRQMLKQTEKDLQAAVRVLDHMEKDEGSRPNDVTYCSILVGLYRGQWLSVEEAEEWRKDIVKRMEQRGIEINLPTYHTLIKACLEYPHPEGLQHALEYYNEMVRRKVPLVQTTWYILLAGLLQRGEWAIAKELISPMFSSGIQPGGTLLNLVGKIRKHKQYDDSVLS